MHIKVRALLLISCLLGFISMAHAKDGEAEMAFHGTLFEPPQCTIDNNQRIDVNFGDRLGISKLDGVNYRQLINYQVTCDAVGRGNSTLMLILEGKVAGFDSLALLTDKSDLGIRIYQNDKPFTPNSTLKIDPANPPQLEAVPVKNTGATLTEGSFDAWVTLRADYQ
ncbi:type 1 fimbria pilin [Rahnella inusitata]|nr:type 1 fimbria pilin [Rahnella inusitata]